MVRRHGRRRAQDVRRRFVRSHSGDALLVNSLPKSGTHLLQQIIAVAPLSDFGGFIASTPPLRLREQSTAALRRRLHRVLSGEVTYSHLFHDDELEEAVRTSGMTMVHLHRDPVAVFESELFYLSEMNPYHRMYREFRSCATAEDRFELCLQGLDDSTVYYPRFSERIARYDGWLRSDVCHVVSFEELTASDAARIDAITALGHHLERRNMLAGAVDDFVEAAVSRIDPRASHTFSGGHTGRASARLTDEQRERVEAELGHC